MKWPRWYAVRRMRYWTLQVVERRDRLRATIEHGAAERYQEAAEYLLNRALAKARLWQRRSYR